MPRNRSIPDNQHLSQIRKTKRINERTRPPRDREFGKTDRSKAGAGWMPFYVDVYVDVYVLMHKTFFIVYLKPVSFACYPCLLRKAPRVSIPATLFKDK
jgi:hypothetical protein